MRRYMPEDWAPQHREAYLLIEQELWSRGYPKHYAMRVQLIARFAYLAFQLTGYLINIIDELPDRKRFEWALAKAGHMGGLALRGIERLEADWREDRELDSGADEAPWEVV